MKHRTRIFYGMMICLCLFASGANGASAAAIDLWHNPLECAVSGFPISLSADIFAGESIQDARIYFRAQGEKAFYFVAMTPTVGTRFVGILPGARPEIAAIEYFLLVVDHAGNAVKSNVFSLPISDRAGCPTFVNFKQPEKIEIRSEETISPEIGFTGENLLWNTTGEKETRYAKAAKVIDVKSLSSALPPKKAEKGFAKRSFWNTKTKIAAGVLGLGGGGAAVALATKGKSKDSGPDWTIPADTVAENVTGQLTKTPNLETKCGTIVTNQLFVTNKRAENVTIGTIEYEVVVTNEKPVGSCEPGRVGAFAPDGDITIPPNGTMLIKQWANEVNSCASCPYLSAKCEWKSRFVIHTSAGNAFAEATFRAEGNLCGATTQKAQENGTPLGSDFQR